MYWFVCVILLYHHVFCTWTDADIFICKKQRWPVKVSHAHVCLTNNPPKSISLVLDILVNKEGVKKVQVKKRGTANDEHLRAVKH